MKQTLYGITGNMGLGKLRKPEGQRSPHSRYRKINNVPMHRVIVEHRTGLKLKPHQVVHHVDPKDKFTNQGLFVVCENAEYHALLERRGRALRECGNANWLRCFRCGEWDDPKCLIVIERKGRKGNPTRIHALHQELYGECVPLAEPRPVNAGICPVSPSRRHNVNTNKRRRVENSGLEAKCAHCGATIRRNHLEAVRWYAISMNSVSVQVDKA